MAEMRCRISRISSMTGSGIAGFMIGSEKFQGCDECWNEKTKQRVDPANVSELVGVGNMLTIPSDQKVAFVKRRDGQVQRIARWIGWHDLVANVSVNDLRDFIVD